MSSCEHSEEGEEEDTCPSCSNNPQGNFFVHSNPQGSFFVQLKQHNFLDHYYKAGAINNSENKLLPAKNIVYSIDEPGNYIQRFNNLTTLNKLKINIRNIVGKPLWGCDNCRAESDDLKKNTSEKGKETNLLRFELMFKVKYYVNVKKNDFLLQNS